MEAFLLETTSPPTLLVGWESSGPFLVLQENRVPSETWQLPGSAEQLDTPEGCRNQVIMEVGEALTSVPMSKKARAEVDRILEELQS